MDNIMARGYTNVKTEYVSDVRIFQKTEYAYDMFCTLT